MMATDEAKPTDAGEENRSEPALLERRLSAAGIDIAIVMACGAGIAFSFNPFMDARTGAVWMIAAVVLCGVMLLELLTGITPGKNLLKLHLLRSDGRRLAIGQCILRGTVRLFPVFLLLASTWVTSMEAYFVLAAFTFIVASAYFPACYITIMRTGRTIFDLIAGTRLVRRR